MAGARHTAGAYALKKAAIRHFKREGRRSLPWRTEPSPYRVLVSEYMLQQTQVERVIPKFQAFIKAFPDWEALARASLSDVYALWRGLGYNRRARFLRDAAKIVALRGFLPDDAAFIRALPGVGEYTAGAIRTFAFGSPEPFVETNIRTAVAHHCFARKSGVRDEEIVRVLEALAPRRGKRAFDWYAALMDYGAHLKRTGVRINGRMHGYAKQKAFKGSLRQLRGAILRELAEGPAPAAALARGTGRSAADMEHALSGLMRDALIEKRGRTYRLAR